MPPSPKIIVLKSREIVYTVILIFLALLLILCMVLMFTGPKEKKASALSFTEETHTSRYIPGLYTSALSLGGNSVNVEVTVDENQITGIQLANLNAAVTASFPLVSPAFEHLVNQILETQSLEQISCSQESRYTSQLLFSAIEKALNLASGSSSN